MLDWGFRLQVQRRPRVPGQLAQPEGESEGAGEGEGEGEDEGEGESETTSKARLPEAWSHSASGGRMQGAGCRVQGAGCRVQGSGGCGRHHVECEAPRGLLPLSHGREDATVDNIALDRQQLVRCPCNRQPRQRHPRVRVCEYGRHGREGDGDGVFGAGPRGPLTDRHVAELVDMERSERPQALVSLGGERGR